MILDVSIIVGFLGAHVIKIDIGKLYHLLHEHCMVGFVSLEHGDTKSHLHVRARIKSTIVFGILAKKYMGWYGIPKRKSKGRVQCKVLINKQLHTFCRMMGYCLKDTRAEYFETTMHNINDKDIIEGKTLCTQSLVNQI